MPKRVRGLTALGREVRAGSWPPSKSGFLWTSGDAACPGPGHKALTILSSGALHLELDRNLLEQQALLGLWRVAQLADVAGPLVASHDPGLAGVFHALRVSTLDVPTQAR